MALPIESLRIRYGDTAINGASLSVQWQVYHPTTSTIVESGWVTVPLIAPTRIPEAWDAALVQIASITASVLAKHKPNSSIGNYSVFDADLILDSWLSDTVNQTLVHPLSGTFTGVTYSGIVGLVNAILARVLGPAVWFWTESLAPLQLRVKCVAVAGATSYNVYDGTALLGTVPNANWNTLAVAAGTYSVRIAPVKAGVVGIASFPVAVTVLEAGGLAEGVRMISTLGEPEPSLAEEEPTPTRWQRVKAWLRETFWGAE